VSATTLRGIWAAVPTPVTAELAPDVPRARAYYRDLLRDGCDGINVLGTTGEAMSFSLDQRLRFMEAVASNGLPRERVMCGTGAASLHDASRLTRAAFELGFAAALVMPPFFFRDAGDDGIVAFFDRLFALAPPPNERVLLYNFPLMSGITFSPALVTRLIDAFPGVIAGMKDSSNDRALQRDIRARHAQLAIFPSAEDRLLDDKAEGAPGCISGSVSLWPQPARDALAGSDEAAQTVAAKRRALEGLPLIAAVRYLTARARNDDAWERAMPPLTPLTAAQRSALLRQV
jgi:4-hydroxy-tetrahydrodipicolinate synthase